MCKVGASSLSRRIMSKRKADEFDDLCLHAPTDRPALDYFSGEDNVLSKRPRYSQTFVPEASESSSTSWPSGGFSQQVSPIPTATALEGQASAGSLAASNSSSWRLPEYCCLIAGSPSVTGQSDSMHTEEGTSVMIPQALSGVGMEAPALQRSNSLPNLRVAVSGPLNQLPSVVMGPPMPREMGLPTPASTIGAMVPYKAPQEVVHDALRYTINQQLQDLKKQRRLAREAREAAAAAAAAEGGRDATTAGGEEPEFIMDDAAPAKEGADTAASEEPEIAMDDAVGDPAAALGFAPACAVQTDLGGTTQACGGTAAPPPPVGPGIGLPGEPHVAAAGGAPVGSWPAYPGLGPEGTPKEVPHVQFMQPPVAPPGAWLSATPAVIPSVPQAPQVTPPFIISPLSMGSSVPGPAPGLLASATWNPQVPPGFGGGRPEGDVTKGVGSIGTAAMASGGQSTWQGPESATWLPPPQGAPESYLDLERIPSVTMMDADE